MKTNRILKGLLLVIFGLMSVMESNAQDRLFTYTYQSTVLNKGQKELETWATVRTGRDNFYLRLDNRLEFETGIARRLQTAFYLNLTTKTQFEMEDTVGSIQTENEISFSNEWKYKILDPVADPIGLALYFEYSIGSKELELEGKLILDKRIGDFTIAANAVYEHEFEAELEDNELEWEEEQVGEIDLALAYSFNPKFALSFENSMRMAGKHYTAEHMALYSGLGFSWVPDGGFWLNFTVLPQVYSFADEYKRLDLKEYERVQARLVFSYVF